MKFVSSLLDDLEKYDPETQKMVLKFAITVYLTITIREKAEGMLYSLQKKIHSGFELLPEMKEWMVNLFSEPLIIE